MYVETVHVYYQKNLSKEREREREMSEEEIGVVEVEENKDDDENEEVLSSSSSTLVESPETYEGRQSLIRDSRKITCISAKDLDDVLDIDPLIDSSESGDLMMKGIEEKDEESGKGLTVDISSLTEYPVQCPKKVSDEIDPETPTSDGGEKEKSSEIKILPSTNPPQRPKTLPSNDNDAEKNNNTIKSRRRTSLQLQMSEASTKDSFRRNTKFGSIFKVRRHCERALSEGKADAKECRDSILKTREEAARHPICPMVEVPAGYFQGYVYVYGSILSSISSSTADRFWVVLDRLHTPPGLGGVRKRKSSRSDFCPVLRIHSKRTSFPDNMTSHLECVAWLLHTTRIVIARDEVTTTMMITGVHVAEALDGLPLRFPQTISFVFQEQDTQYMLKWKRVLEGVLPLKKDDGMSLGPRHRSSTISTIPPRRVSNRNESTTGSSASSISVPTMSGSTLDVPLSSQDSNTSTSSSHSSLAEEGISMDSLDDRILIPVRAVDDTVVNEFLKRSQCVERLFHLNRDEKYCTSLGLWEEPYKSEQELARMLMEFFEYRDKNKMELCLDLARQFVFYPFELHHKLLRRYGRALFVC